MQEISSEKRQRGDVSGGRPLSGATCLLPGGTFGRLLFAKKKAGRYDWLFVTLSYREAHFGYLLVTKNVRYSRVALWRPPVEGSIFCLAVFKRTNDPSTNRRCGEIALWGSCRIPVVTCSGFLPLIPAVPSFFSPTPPRASHPHSYRLQAGY